MRWLDAVANVPQVLCWFAFEDYIEQNLDGGTDQQWERDAEEVNTLCILFSVK